MSGIIEERGLKKVIREKHEEIKKVYLNDERPWVIGYSGGKDSTTIVQLIYNALKELPKEKLHKSVYVISSDTLVENPLILKYVENNLDNIEIGARFQNIPITSHKVNPNESDTFWVLLIGKGYPSPRQKFRWCTDRLKISPVDKFIKEKINEFGEAIVVLGVRRAESSTRAGVIDSHNIEGKILKKHTLTNNAFVYAPIEDFTLDDVWTYLMAVESPWGGDNRELLTLYKNSKDASECPLQVDKDAPSCGNSRFGCWVCTVVKEDKSLDGFIKNGHTELRPLLKFRDKLYNIRENRDKRMKRRINGAMYSVTNGEGERKIGLGPFTMEARKELLRDLLIVQRQTGFNLIQDFELELIRQIWLDNGDWEDSLPKIYKDAIGKDFGQNYSERPLFKENEVEILKSICEEEEVSVELIKKLITIENSFYGMKHRSGILNNIGKTLKQDWVHEDIVKDFLDVEEGA